jgi:hypothetical protein
MRVVASSAPGRTLLLLLAVVVPACGFQEDPVAQAGRETRRLLENYKSGYDAKPVLIWLTGSHGEAPGSEVMNVFLRWAVSNPVSAEAVTKDLASRDEGALARRVAWAAVDSGNEQRLVVAFGSTNSDFFRLVLEECRKFDDCAAAMSSNTSLERTRER